MDKLEAKAFRAAGQTYAAAVLGLAIKRVTSDGIESLEPANRDRSFDERRAEIAMGLAGIASVDRYGFRTAPEVA